MTWGRSTWVEHDSFPSSLHQSCFRGRRCFLGFADRVSRSPSGIVQPPHGQQTLSWRFTLQLGASLRTMSTHKDTVHEVPSRHQRSSGRGVVERTWHSDWRHLGVPSVQGALWDGENYGALEQRLILAVSSETCGNSGALSPRPSHFGAFHALRTSTAIYMWVSRTSLNFGAKLKLDASSCSFRI